MVPLGAAETKSIIIGGLAASRHAGQADYRGLADVKNRKFIDGGGVPNRYAQLISVEDIMNLSLRLGGFCFFLFLSQACQDSGNPVLQTPPETYHFDSTLPWEQSKDAEGVNITALCVVSDAAGNSRILAGSWTGIFGSMDNGRTWMHSNIGLADTAISAFAFQATMVYTGTDRNGVFRSTDYGSSWIPSSNGMTGRYVTDLLTTPDGYLFASTNGSGIFASSNNGTTWAPVDSGLGSQIVYTIAATTDMLNRTSLFAGTFERGIFLSSNCGSVWQPANNGLASPTVEALAIGDNGAFAGTYDCIYRSTNNGFAWVAMNNGLSHTAISDICVLQDHIVVATAGAGVFLSTNNGANWSPQNFGLPTDYVFCLAVSRHNSNGHTLFAGTNNGIWKHAL